MKGETNTQEKGGIGEDYLLWVYGGIHVGDWGEATEVDDYK